MENLTNRELTRVAVISRMNLGRLRRVTWPVSIILVALAIYAFVYIVIHGDNASGLGPAAFFSFVVGLSGLEALALYGIIQNLAADHPLQSQIASVDLGPLRRRNKLVFIGVLALSFALFYFRHQ